MIAEAVTHLSCHAQVYNLFRTLLYAPSRKVSCPVKHNTLPVHTHRLMTDTRAMIVWQVAAEHALLSAQALMQAEEASRKASTLLEAADQLYELDHPFHT